jgi:hypothetical protein
MDECKKRVARLEAEITGNQAELRALEPRLTDGLRSEMREIVGFARERGHAWIDRRAPGLPPNHDDEQLIRNLVEVFSAMALGRAEVDIDRRRRELKQAKKELKRWQEMRRWLETGGLQ